jgi:uncharacterized protein YjiS (DUF1127 family)
MRATERLFGFGHGTSGQPFWAGAATAFATITSAWRMLRNRKEINGLNEMDDSQLADIGLTRADLRHALLTSSLFEDPSASLSQSARRSARSSIFRSLRD